jgi:putative oxidoreductase
MSESPGKPTLLIPALGGIYTGLSSLMEPLLRVAVGLMLIPHGAQKLFGAFGGGGIAGTAGFLESVGYSNATVWAALIAVVEFFGGACLALGLLTRPAAVAIAAFLGSAVVFHSANGFFWTGGGFEYPLLWTVCALYFAVRGGGHYSVDAQLGKEF